VLSRLDREESSLGRLLREELLDKHLEPRHQCGLSERVALGEDMWLGTCAVDGDGLPFGIHVPD
jgi:hypothetical protein